VLPTLNGRIQTRIFLTAMIGGLWTLLVTPLLPGLPSSLGASYRITFVLLLTVMVLGIGWELIYHFLQQFRWEKDWPTLFGLVTAINEGVLVLALLTGDRVPGLGVPGPSIGLAPFLIDFLSVWIVVWLVANGPMRVPFVHWRFRGGRLV
jgi:hypothetical protein